MLAELLLRLATPSVLHRSLGFVSDSVALWSRATRRRSDWAPHEERCKGLVCEAMRDLERRHTALVLGSGLCRDIPLEALSDGFQRVILVDAVHLPLIRRRARRFANVSLATVDLTGVADWLLGRADRRGDPLRPFVADPAIDLVVSANVLSQLPLAPERYLARNGRPHVPEDLPERIVGWHIDDLARFRGRVCLMTDVECLDVAATARGLRAAEPPGGHAVLARLDLLRGHELPVPDAAWTWTVAPPGEVERGVALVHVVHGYKDLAATWRRTAHPAP
ncbi:hypothetical protein [Salinarimonas soli]|uniref:Class I SAM-dependent methyltransferase n=1 Tax=Salinarimonas soli TaxID=1638099 RepID=A0A5B2VQN5_9HYPH|nr:hypothetical protein [Salinarimonas soli]KAA2241074.1 hypothetical protein F0L46_04560 [Salinarimonas soli]